MFFCLTLDHLMLFYLIKEDLLDWNSIYENFSKSCAFLTEKKHFFCHKNRYIKSFEFDAIKLAQKHA